MVVTGLFAEGVWTLRGISGLPTAQKGSIRGLQGQQWDKGEIEKDRAG